MLDPRWRQVRLLHRWSFGMWIGWLPFAITLISLEDRFLPQVVPILGILYVAVFLGVSMASSHARCPRCNELFFFRFALQWRWEAPWAPRCAHCEARIGDSLPGSAK